MWCVPTLDTAYKERMLDVLDLYEQAHDPLLPVVCLDEKSVELHDERHRPIKSRSGVRRDHEYIRRGTANIFMLTEPKGGKHYVRVSPRRTRKEFAHCLKWLARHYPKAITIHLVMDNLNTHNEKSLMETFGTEDGRRLWRASLCTTPLSTPAGSIKPRSPSVSCNGVASAETVSQLPQSYANASSRFGRNAETKLGLSIGASQRRKPNSGLELLRRSTSLELSTFWWTASCPLVIGGGG